MTDPRRAAPAAAPARSPRPASASTPTGTSGLSGAASRPPIRTTAHADLRLPASRTASRLVCARRPSCEWGIDHPPPLRRRHDGFTRRRSRSSSHAYATGSVSDAARAAGITRKTAYDLWKPGGCRPVPRTAWDEALRGPANVVLAATAYDRAINGVEEAVWYKGEFRGWRVRHDSRLLMWLLRVRDPLNFAPLDDLAGWLPPPRRRGHLPTEPMIDRLEAAERAWEKRAPGSEAYRPSRTPRPPPCRARGIHRFGGKPGAGGPRRAGEGKGGAARLEDGRTAGEAGGDAEPAP